MQHLPHAARQDIKFWRERLVPVLSLTRGVTQALERIASDTETPYPTVRRKFYALKDRGVMALLDRRLAGPRYWKTKAERTTTLSEVDRAVVKLYAEDNNRSSRQAAKDMRKDWRIGKIRTTTETDARTGYPHGWSLGNLAKHISDAFELAAARKGRALASSNRRLVYTTRKDLWVGSHYMFDDLWHDFFVNSFAEKQAGRPLELFSHDLFSARKVRWGIRVRTQKEDGTMHGLAENMTRYVAAATLYLDGYSERGTVLVAEHGTAAIKGSTKQRAGVYLREGIDEALYRFSEPAAYMRARGAKLPGRRYLDILRGVIAGIVKDGSLGRSRNRPLYLRKCMQDHMQFRGEAYLNEAKGLQTKAAGPVAASLIEKMRHMQTQADPEAERLTAALVAARELLTARPGVKKSRQP